MAEARFMACAVCGKIFRFQRSSRFSCSKKCAAYQRRINDPDKFNRNSNSYKTRYRQQRHNAFVRDIPFHLTFNEWLDIWLTSGKWEQRGWRKGQYCMARFGDIGAYEVGNVIICLAEENRAERNKNYPMRGEANPAFGQNYWAVASELERLRRGQAISNRQQNKPQSQQMRKRLSATVTGRRSVLREGRRTWAYPDDPDYPT